VHVGTRAANDIAELGAEFKVMLQATNRSPATIVTYMSGLQALREYLVERGKPTAVDAVARMRLITRESPAGGSGGASISPLEVAAQDLHHASSSWGFRHQQSGVAIARH